MASFRCKDRDGSLHVIEGREGFSLMELIRDSGLSVEAICGGAASCGTCHVYVAENDFEKLPDIRDEEDLIFDRLFNLQKTSRLSCQVMWEDAYDGIQVFVAET